METIAERQRTYLPAAGHDWFLPLYDPFVKLFGGDRARRALLDQSSLRPGQRVLDIGEAGLGEIGEPPGMDTGAVIAVPRRVVLLDKLFGRLDDISGQRQPIEMGNDKPAFRRYPLAQTTR